MTDLSGTTALITGGSSGIGAKVAEGLARRGGARIAIMARRRAHLEEVGRRIESLGAEALVLPCDVTSHADVAESVRHLLSMWRAPDLVFLNAGIGEAVSASRVDVSHVRRIMEVNFFGAVNVLDSILEPMIARGGGRVVATSSLAASRGLPGFAAYSASKAALDRYIEGLRVELSGRGLDFTLAEPGFVRTPLTEKNKFPMPFLIEADEAAERILGAVARGRARLTFPLPMAIATGVLKLLPDRLYDRIMSKASPSRPPASPKQR
jgi:NAD(P)-dependent dehydrogenase (short-subunit alcohol dehydrogenase family)